MRKPGMQEIKKALGKGEDGRSQLITLPSQEPFVPGSLLKDS